MKITNGGSPIVSQNCQVDEHTFLFHDGGGRRDPDTVPTVQPCLKIWLMLGQQ